MAKIIFSFIIYIYSSVMHNSNSIDTNTLVLILCIALALFAAGLDDIKRKK